MPFAFCYSGGLLLNGGIMAILEAVIPVTVGIIFIAMGLAGYMFRDIPLVFRVLAVVGGIMMMAPQPVIILAGLAGGIIVVIRQYWIRKKTDRTDMTPI